MHVVWTMTAASRIFSVTWYDDPSLVTIPVRANRAAFINNPDFPDVNAALQKLADKYGVSKNAIGAAWILRHPAKFQVIAGTMNPEHLKDTAAGADVHLTNQEWYDVYLAAGNDLP